jgi:hypothetical protein
MLKYSDDNSKKRRDRGVAGESAYDAKKTNSQSWPIPPRMSIAFLFVAFLLVQKKAGQVLPCPVNYFLLLVGS